MKRSEKIINEIVKAKEAIEGMSKSKKLEDFEEHWKMFLNRLERVWNKASNFYKDSPKWNGWKGKYENARNKDPLLLYLKNARGADEHTINEILSREPSKIGIRAGNGKTGYIKKAIFNKGNIYLESPHNIRIDFIPARIMLLPIVNRGVTYNVPKTHLNKPIDPGNIIELSKIAIKYYDTFITEAEKQIPDFKEQ
jgi:hypothetical protein